MWEKQTTCLTPNLLCFYETWQMECGRKVQRSLVYFHFFFVIWTRARQIKVFKTTFEHFWLHLLIRKKENIVNFYVFVYTFIEHKSISIPIYSVFLMNMFSAANLWLFLFMQDLPYPLFSINFPMNENVYVKTFVFCHIAKYDNYLPFVPTFFFFKQKNNKIFIFIFLYV